MVEQVATAVAPTGCLLRGSTFLMSVGGGEDEMRRLVTAAAHLLQVQNLVVLMGAGASFHFGGPSIRSMDFDHINQLVDASSQVFEATEADATRALVGDGIDLEDALAILSNAIAYASKTQTSEVRLGADTFSVSTLVAVRRRLNRALAHACDVPKEDVRADPLAHHREFFARILRSRREELRRVSIFTTNYDLAIERALDQLGVPYFDGFAGTIERVMRPETYTYEMFLAEPAHQPRRLATTMSLFKLHGSVNWRSRAINDDSSSSVIFQTRSLEAGDDEGLALIYPTPEKETDAVGYPYSEMFRHFNADLSRPETALLVTGYGFGDAHVNRHIYQALASNPSLHIFVAAPTAVLAEGPICSYELHFAEDSPLSALAQRRDARISVLTGDLARFENLVRWTLPGGDEDEHLQHQRGE